MSVSIFSLDESLNMLLSSSWSEVVVAEPPKLNFSLIEDPVNYTVYCIFVTMHV